MYPEVDLEKYRKIFPYKYIQNSITYEIKN